MSSDDAPMKLSDFVGEALKQVMEGVRHAQEAAREHGGAVNPYASTQTAGGPYYRVTKVSFDVSLTTTEGSDRGGGVGVFAGAFGVGGNLHSADSASSAGRIEFSVDVLLPVDHHAMDRMRPEGDK